MDIARKIILAQIAIAAITGVALIVAAGGVQTGQPLLLYMLVELAVLGALFWGILRHLKLARLGYLALSVLSFFSAISVGLYFENLLGLLDAVLCLSASYYLLTDWPDPAPS